MSNNPQPNNQNKKSVSEQGHTINLENFKRLYDFCFRNQPDYNPTLDKIKINNLASRITDAENAHKQAFITHSAVISAINHRQELYQNLNPLVTRVIQALHAATDDDRIVADARTYINKIHGKYTKPKTDDQNPSQETKPSYSNSQRSFVKLREHLYSLINLLEKIPQYTPNETELTTIELNNYLNQLIQADSQITQLKALYKQALIQRDKLFYDTPNALVPTTSTIKTYIKSLYGIKSLQYNEVRKLTFKSYKR